MKEDNKPTVIKISVPEYDPKLDPESTEFDRSAYVEMLKAGLAPDLREKVKSRLEDVLHSMVTLYAQDADAAGGEYQTQITQAAEQAASALYAPILDELQNAPQQLAIDGFQMPQNEFENALDRVIETEQGKEQLEMALQSIHLPDKIAHNSDKVSRKFFRNLLPPDTEITVDSGPEIPIGTGSRKTLEKMESHVEISLLELPDNISISRDPSLWDDVVHSLAGSLYENGNTIITPDSIYRAYLKDPAAAPTEERRKEIDESMLRMMSMLMTIRTNKAMEAAYGISMNVTENVISATRIEAEITNQYGTHKIIAYKLKTKPLLFRYADSINQVQRFLPEVFNTPINKTTEIIVLQSALLDTIEQIKAGTRSNHILYDTLFGDCKTFYGLSNEQAKRKKSVMRRHIHKMLDYWKSKGVIKDWSEIMKGRSATGLIIKYHKKALQQAEQ